LPAKLTATARLYQPFASAPRAGDGVTDGAVASYWKEMLFGAETSPAPLVHVALAEAEPESGPENVTEAQVTPDTDPVPVAVICTGWLYQPFESGPRAKFSAVTVGVVVSNLIVTDLPVMVPSVSVTVQATVCPAVSFEIVYGPQFAFEMLDPETLNVTTTCFVYQPVLHEPVTPPEEHVHVIVTSALAAAGANSATAAISVARATTFIAPPHERRAQGTGR
jgi:hypothetical protein